MFKVVVAMEDVGQSESFPEAFRVLYEKLNEAGKDGLNLGFLDTVWMEYPVDGEGLVMNFSQCRDVACALGLLKERRLQENIEVQADLVELFFVLAHCANKGTDTARYLRMLEQRKIITKDDPEGFVDIVLLQAQISVEAKSAEEKFRELVNHLIRGDG